MERSQGTNDTTVPETQDQDASMEDSGGRPPGAPPEGTWAQKVAGQEAGGIPAPESVISDEFVMTRMRIEFPNGEEGEPEISIGQDVIEAMAGLWKQCLYVKVLGRKVSLPTLDRKLRELWKPIGGMWIVDLPRQFFMIRFELEEDYWNAFTGGPWRVFGSYLLIKEWSSDFDPLRDSITTTPVWIRISGIPMVFYHRTIIKGIASTVGHPVRIDATTLRFERGRFARVCVVVDLRKPLKGSALVNGERYFVEYEGLESICSSCGLYGHLVASCPKRSSNEGNLMTAEKAQDVGVNAEVTKVDDRSKTLAGDGFIPVKNPARVHRGNTKVVTGAGKSSGTNVAAESSAQLQCQNRFVSLNVDSQDDIMVSNDMDDPNSGPTEIPSEIAAPVIATPVVVETGEGSKGIFERQAGKVKSGKDASGGPKQIKKNKPKVKKPTTRGLIFGSIGEAKETIHIGKRMRTEEKMPTAKPKTGDISVDGEGNGQGC
ncbi:hypothetical protein V2J09_012590 [Rumex salicifolius]